MKNEIGWIFFLLIFASFAEGLIVQETLSSAPSRDGEFSCLTCSPPGDRLQSDDASQAVNGIQPGNLATNSSKEKNSQADLQGDFDSPNASTFFEQESEDRFAQEAAFYHQNHAIFCDFSRSVLDFSLREIKRSLRESPLSRAGNSYSVLGGISRHFRVLPRTWNSLVQIFSEKSSLFFFDQFFNRGNCSTSLKVVFLSFLK